MSVSLYGSGNTIIQAQNTTIQNNTGAGYVSTTSTSYVTTGVSVSITPQATTSKILILVQGITAGASNINVPLTIYRGGTNLVTGTAPGDLYANSYAGPGTTFFLDSPATTSATTYTVYIRSSTGGAVYFGYPPSTACALSITALEISGS